MMERYHEIVDYNRCLYDCSAKYKMAALKAQLAEATEAARLQVALDRIEAAGYWWELTCIAGYSIVVKGFSVWNRSTAVEAAEKAAEWAEGQAISICSKCGGQDPTCYICGVEKQKEASHDNRL